MDEPQNITTDHLRSLLEAGGGAILGLVGGAVEVIGADDLETDRYRGALEVITHDDLRERLAGDASGDALEHQAEALTNAARLLGG